MDRNPSGGVLISSYQVKQGTEDLFEALSEENKALDESLRVSQGQPLCFECVVGYLHDSVPSSNNSQNCSQEHHHQPSYHGEQWKLEGLIYK